MNLNTNEKVIESIKNNLLQPSLEFIEMNNKVKTTSSEIMGRDPN